MEILVRIIGIVGFFGLGWLLWDTVIKIGETHEILKKVEKKLHLDKEVEK